MVFHFKMVDEMQAPNFISSQNPSEKYFFKTLLKITRKNGKAEKSNKILEAVEQRGLMVKGFHQPPKAEL